MFIYEVDCSIDGPIRTMLFLNCWEAFSHAMGGTEHHLDRCHTTEILDGNMRPKPEITVSKNKNVVTLGFDGKPKYTITKTKTMDDAS